MTVDVARAALETTLAERDGMLVQNTGARDLVVVKFFGPDISGSGSLYYSAAVAGHGCGGSAPPIRSTRRRSTPCQVSKFPRALRCRKVSKFPRALPAD